MMPSKTGEKIVKISNQSIQREQTPPISPSIRQKSSDLSSNNILLEQKETSPKPPQRKYQSTKEMTISPQLMNKLGNLTQIEEEKLEIGDMGLLDKRKELDNLKDI